jgi:hypothetical protein
VIINQSGGVIEMDSYVLFPFKTTKKGRRTFSNHAGERRKKLLRMASQGGNGGFLASILRG